MAIRRRIDVDVVSHPEQYIAGMAAATAATKTFGAELNATAAKSVAGSEAEFAAAGATAAKRTSASFLGTLQASLGTGFSKLGKSALTDAGSAIGGETGATFASSFGTAAASGLSSVLPGLAAVFAGFEIDKEFLKLASGAAEYLMQIRDLSIKTGASAESSSKLAYAFGVLGIDIASTERPLNQFAKSLQAGGGPLKAFLSDQELTKLRNEDLKQGLDDVARKYGSIQDPIERAAFATAAFGSRGTAALQPYLEATDEMRAKWDALAQQSNLVFTSSQLQQAKEYSDATKELGLAFRGLEIQLGTALVPIITGFVRLLDGAVIGVESFVRAVAHLPALTSALSSFVPTPIRILLEALPHLGADASGLGAAFDSLAGGLDDTAKAADDVAKAVEGIDKSIDPLKSFSLPDPTQQAQKLADANNALADAEQRVADAQSRISQNERYITRTPERDRELARDKQALADATRDVGKAQQDAAKAKKSTDVATTVEGDYQAEVAKMQRFVKELDEAARRGVDPGFLAKAIADPEKYLPILDALVKEKPGGKLESTINSSESQLRTISTRLDAAGAVVGQSLGDAIAGGVGKMTGDLETELHTALTGSAQQAYALATTIGQNIGDNIAQGITAGIGEAAITAGLVGAAGPGAAAAAAGLSAGGAAAAGAGVIAGTHFAEGGISAHIANSPTILYGERSTGGEAFIPLGPQHRGRSTSLLGEVAERLGYGIFPRAMASGGFVGSVQNNNSRSLTNQQVFNGDIRVHDPREFERWADRRKRQNALMGVGS